ncbi:MAG: vorB, partial [Deltaproteobacteria bacterium]|nr:vorB [Deltaproteobacteria bacterium]
MSGSGKAEFTKPVYARPRSLVDVKTHFCPGCHHGTIHKIVAECIDRYEVREKTIGVACV